MTGIREPVDLYRLEFGNKKIVCNAPCFPRVPRYTILGEDEKIERICVAQSLDDCLTGIGPNGIWANANECGILENIKDFCNVALPFTVIHFVVDRYDAQLKLPGKIKDYVPDAFLSQEHWLTKPTVPVSVEQLWLVDCEISYHPVPLNGMDYTYPIFENSYWSREECSARLMFWRRLADATWGIRKSSVHVNNSITMA